jgi:signal peptidase I
MLEPSAVPAPDLPQPQQPQMLAPARRSRIGPFLAELLTILVVVIAVVYTTRAFVVEAYVIHGKSMEPTFHDSERLLISKFAPRFERLERGDIVIFNHPDEPGKRLIKRIIGLPGDTVKIEDGKLYLTGELFPEPYLEAPPHDFYQTHAVEPEHYFVLGDNRDISNDSRRMGTIPADAIIGKALILFYPKLKVF